MHSSGIRCTPIPLSPSQPENEQVSPDITGRPGQSFDFTEYRERNKVETTAHLTGYCAFLQGRFHEIGAIITIVYTYVSPLRYHQYQDWLSKKIED